MRAPYALLVLSLALGCGDTNAVLELELRLPPQADAPRFAAVQARRASVGFDDPWDGSGLLAAPLGAEPRELAVSVVSESSYDEALLVRIRYCATATCDALGDERAPESRLVIERAFYLGERTHARWEIDALPTQTDPEPEQLDRCEVRGCRAGVAASYCRADGSHFCE
ncbi:MAG: hypothetical protein KF901_07435 [Myxococcales bacterium]|nr:hypothetical protein [Myxococcales bacterium]